MPARIQGLAIGLGSAKQSDVATISPTFNRWRKLDLDAPTLDYGTETDKDEVGKGHEFITQVFPTAWEVGGSLRKYGSAEFMLWAWGYALGDVSLGTGLYTINAKDPGVSLETPYFTLVQQLAEGGGMAIDEALIGCSITDVTTEFRYGPGRASVTTNASFVGSGRHTLPSAVSLPDTLAENFTLSSGMAITINGVNYVTEDSILMGSMSWNNNPILPMRFRPGGGIVSGAAVGTTTFFGNRAPGLSFTVFLKASSLELTKLIAQTSGTAVVTLTYDATHFVTWTYHNVSFERVTRTVEEGLVCVTVTVAPKYDSGLSGVLTVTGKCGISDIAQ